MLSFGSASAATSGSSGSGKIGELSPSNGLDSAAAVAAGSVFGAVVAVVVDGGCHNS